MTPPTPLTALADRVQALTSACRETDALIWAEINGRDIRWEEKMLLGRSRKPPHDECRIGYIDPGAVDRNFTLAWSQPEIPAYTASLDAAMTLVPDGHAFSARRNCSQDGEVVYCNAQVWPYSSPREDVPHHWANSPEGDPALALTAASLRARAALENSHG